MVTPLSWLERVPNLQEAFREREEDLLIMSPDGRQREYSSNITARCSCVP